MTVDHDAAHLDHDAAHIDHDAMRADARTFREAGCVVLEDVFAADWVASLRAAYDTLVARYLSDRGGLEALAGKTFGKNPVGIHKRPSCYNHVLTSLVTTTFLHQLRMISGYRFLGTGPV